MISVSEIFSNYIFYSLTLIFLALCKVLQLCKRYFISLEKQEKEKPLDVATKNDSNAKAYIFQWKIEKLHHSCLKGGERIKSPIFSTDKLDDTKWSLELYPQDGNFVSVYLKREKDFFGPAEIAVKYQLAFLNKDGSILKNRDTWQAWIKRDCSGIWPVRETREKVFDIEKQTFLPEDTLKIQCKLWKKNEKPLVSEMLSARTIFEMHWRSFVWKIENFSARTFGEFDTVKKMKSGLFDFDLVLNETNNYKKDLYIGIRSFDNCINMFSFKASIIDSEGERVNFKNNDINDHLQAGNSFSLHFSKRMLMKQRSLYLSNEVLSLYCECIFSTATTFFECSRCRTFSSSVIHETVRNRNELNFETEKPEFTPSIVSDLKSMFLNATLSDVELRTSTQTFPAHKAILSARSTVFRKMFMKEKNSGHVDITDLEDEIVHLMLAYIYTDSLGDLQVDTATKLYIAANKYDVPSLKRKCISFLKDNMSPITVCGFLLLADMHQDSDLKSAVEDYIMEHDKEVFDAQEWKHFMDTHLRLAADVMYRKVSQC